MDTSQFEEQGMDREAMIERILFLQQELAKRDKQSRDPGQQWRQLVRLFKLVVVYFILGRRLSRALADLIRVVKERKRPYLGSELARALDAASRKVMGYKRWLLLLGIMAALPGFVSVVLLWQQNQVVKHAKIDRLADLRNQQRVELLTTIYQTHDKSEAGLLTTPVFSASNRRQAVLELIHLDAGRLEQRGEADGLNLNRMVDLSVAPLNGIDFSTIPGESAWNFRNIGFVNSNFENTSFSGCRFENVWFSHAQLYGTDFRAATFTDVDFSNARIVGADFRGAEFLRCDFSGAQFDESTRWPEDFDPTAAGALKMEDHE